MWQGVSNIFRAFPSIRFFDCLSKSLPDPQLEASSIWAPVGAILVSVRFQAVDQVGCWRSLPDASIALPRPIRNGKKRECLPPYRINIQMISSGHWESTWIASADGDQQGCGRPPTRTLKSLSFAVLLSVSVHVFSRKLYLTSHQIFTLCCSP